MARRGLIICAGGPAKADQAGRRGAILGRPGCNPQGNAMTDDLTTHETKAARLMVLYRLRQEGQLDGHSDADLARAFRTRRETIWKDKQALKRADQLYNQVMARQPWADKASMTVRAAAAALGCDAVTVYGLIHGGLVKAHKGPTGRWRIPAAEIERLQQVASTCK